MDMQLYLFEYMFMVLFDVSNVTDEVYNGDPIPLTLHCLAMKPV
jgi:hypothetical protein